MRAAAVVVAAGSGTRMGGPKQFLPLLGRAVVEWSLDVFLGLEEVEQVVLVLTGENLRRHGPRLVGPRLVAVEGGATRLESVRRGLAALAPGAEVVAVHDGARPLLSAEIARRVLEEALLHGAAVAAVPVKDTLKEGREGFVVRTPERALYWAAQTPQAYRREVLRGALERFETEREATDESQLVERAGGGVRLVPSNHENLKITTPEDMEVAEALLKRRLGLAEGSVRTGFGYDIHRLVSGRELWLAGLRLEHAKGLLGHSDGDAVLHAACDAVLGALGAGEIGLFFPPEEAKHRGVSSRVIVERVLGVCAERRARVVNLDVTLVAEEPRLKPHYERLRASLAGLFRLDCAQVNLKAKSHEGLDALGRGEAIACYAVASIEAPVPQATPPSPSCP